jgi:hypothetical protein
VVRAVEGDDMAIAAGQTWAQLALVASTLALVGTNPALAWTVEQMRDACAADAYACAMGEYLQPKVLPCLGLPREAASEPIDFIAKVRVELKDGVTVSSSVDFGIPDPTPFQVQMAEQMQIAILACQPYGPISGTAVFWNASTAKLLPSA